MLNKLTFGALLSFYLEIFSTCASACFERVKHQRLPLFLLSFDNRVPFSFFNPPLRQERIFKIALQVSRNRRKLFFSSDFFITKRRQNQTRKFFSSFFFFRPHDPSQLSTFHEAIPSNHHLPVRADYSKIRFSLD